MCRRAQNIIISADFIQWHMTDITVQIQKLI